jgi:ubiquinol-cytochrome c reductase cytochrome c1 subunit
MRRIILCALAALIFGAGAAMASEGAPKPPSRDWSFDGVFGRFDRAAMRRGYQVFSEVCASCHALELVAYRNLQEVGFGAGEVREIAAEFEVEDGPNEEGEMYMRPALPFDRFVPPFPNDQAARDANNGAMPPDLSLIVKARKGGADYLHALLTGYKEEPPEGVELNEGMYYNDYFLGHQIAMPTPLMDESVEYEDETKATVEQMSADVVTFLAWAAEPELEARKRMGLWVVVFLVVFTAMLYALKRRIWSDLH